MVEGEKNFTKINEKTIFIEMSVVLKKIKRN